MNAVELGGVFKSLDGRRVLNDITAAIESGTRVVLSGPSGCGKTTLLRVIAGLEVPDAGSVHIAGRCVAHGKRNLIDPEARGIGMVFQDLALWPHMTVTQHLQFAVRYSRKRCADPDARAHSMMELVALEDYAGARPHALSGGQQQRLALARALAGEPGIVLMDEPLSNLDLELKVHLQREILRLHELLHFTLIYVTHDREEAATIGSRILSMRDGTIVSSK
jgi:ABC-type Fe3+/spermidine/putrescine transport system ATPase subunit